MNKQQFANLLDALIAGSVKMRGIKSVTPLPCQGLMEGDEALLVTFADGKRVSLLIQDYEDEEMEGLKEKHCRSCGNLQIECMCPKSRPAPRVSPARMEFESFVGRRVTDEEWKEHQRVK